MIVAVGFLMIVRSVMMVTTVPVQVVIVTIVVTSMGLRHSLKSCIITMTSVRLGTYR